MSNANLNTRGRQTQSKTVCQWQQYRKLFSSLHLVQVSMSYWSQREVSHSFALSLVGATSCFFSICQPIRMLLSHLLSLCNVWLNIWLQLSCTGELFLTFQSVPVSSTSQQTALTAILYITFSCHQSLRTFIKMYNDPPKPQHVVTLNEK